VAKKAAEETWDKGLARQVEKRPIVILRIPPEEVEELAATRNGMSEFTLTRPQDEFADIQTPCLALLFTESSNEDEVPRAYAAIVKRRDRVATLASRIKVKRSVFIKACSRGCLVMRAIMVLCAVWRQASARSAAVLREVVELRANLHLHVRQADAFI
jgi:hypothetical protein